MRTALRPPRILLVAAVAVVAVACAAVLALRGGDDHAPAPPRPPTHPLTIAPGGTDDGVCGPRSPCATFSRAFAVARPGDVVDVRPGSYEAQLLSPDGRPSTSKPVVFAGPPQGGATIDGELEVGAHAVEFRDLTVRGVIAHPGADHVTLRRIRNQAGLFITSASNISVIGGSVGPGVNFSPEIKAAEGSRIPPRNILIDGVTFHDWTRTEADAHVDCLHVLSVDGLVIRRSRFVRCEAFNLLFTSYGLAGPPRNVVVEDSDFSCCRSGYYSISLGTAGANFRNFVIRRNRANKDFSVDEGTTRPGANIRFEGNHVPYANPVLCSRPGTIWRDNVWSAGKPCGPTDRVLGR